MFGVNNALLELLRWVVRAFLVVVVVAFVAVFLIFIDALIDDVCAYLVVAYDNISSRRLLLFSDVTISTCFSHGIPIVLLASYL